MKAKVVIMRPLVSLVTYFIVVIIANPVRIVNRGQAHKQMYSVALCVTSA